MADNEQAEIDALKARLAALEKSGPPPSFAPVEKKKGLGCGGWFAVALLLGVIGVWALAQLGAGEEYAAAPSWSPPTGFEVQEAGFGKSLGVKWEMPEDSECRSGRSCFAITVIPAQACERSLYMSITLLDAAGNNIGWTNDTAQGVRAGETTRMVFTTYEDNVDSARIAEANCY